MLLRDGVTIRKKEHPRERRACREQGQSRREGWKANVRRFRRLVARKSFSGEMQTILTHSRHTVESAAVKPPGLLLTNITVRTSCGRGDRGV